MLKIAVILKMDNVNLTNIESQKQAFNFLNEIYEVLKCFENNPSKLGPKINELKMKYEKARTILSNIPGIDMSHSEQQEYYQNLLKQYKRENELFNSYKEMCQFDITKLDQTPDLTAESTKSEQQEFNLPISSETQFNNNITPITNNTTNDLQTQQVFNPDKNLE